MQFNAQNNQKMLILVLKMHATFKKAKKKGMPEHTFIT